MRLLSHDALINARRIYDIVDTAMEFRRRGHEPQAWATLNEAHSLIRSELPVLNGVIAAQAKAAEGLNLTQGPLSRPLVVSRKPAENLHAANDEHAVSPSELA